MQSLLLPEECSRKARNVDQKYSGSDVREVRRFKRKLDRKSESFVVVALAEINEDLNISFK